MPSVSLFGLLGNFVSMHILHHKEVKLKKDYVDVLCMLATFDNLLLISTFLLFSLPTLSENYMIEVSSLKNLLIFAFLKSLHLIFRNVFRIFEEFGRSIHGKESTSLNSKICTVKSLK